MCLYQGTAAFSPYDCLIYYMSVKTIVLDSFLDLLREKGENEDEWNGTGALGLTGIAQKPVPTDLMLKVTLNVWIQGSWQIIFHLLGKVTAAFSQQLTWGCSQSFLLAG